MIKIVFATNNAHKMQEIRDILGNQFEIVSLKDIGCTADIPETGNTLTENAWQKADYVNEHFGPINVFADDTGLEVNALNGEPGVHSARYAEHTDHDSKANMRKLLDKMENANDRSAQFRTVIALILDGKRYTFEGYVKGHISRIEAGTEGFGYDPVFIPQGYDKSFAELGETVKNKISHRARAVQRLSDFLKQAYEQTAE